MTATPVNTSITTHLLLGWTVVLVLVGGVGGWAATSEISGAVIAPGALVVDSRVKKVQHASGGIVGQILARDGDKVQAGQSLVRLDETLVRTSLSIVLRGLAELHARKSRLVAERDDASELAMPDVSFEPLPAAEVAAIMLGEQRLFTMRRAARVGQKQQLSKRIEQFEQERRGITAQLAAKRREVELISTELTGARELWQKQLTSLSRITSLEREATRLDGERGQLEAALAQTAGRISEVELQIIQIDRELASEVGRELRDVNSKIGELVERRIAAEDLLTRIDIRAPQSGVVHQSSVHTIGGVIAAGETIMLVVPESDQLVVEARVAPNQIDQVRVGQKAFLRLSTMDQASTPELHGEVTHVSADTTSDQRTGQSYYTVRVGIVRSAEHAATLQSLVPGMPIEVFLQTGFRSVMSLLVKPLRDQVVRAFREK